jgi:hypothetical protein
MKKIFLAVLALTSLSGCMTARWVTARTWVGGDTLYVAYTEYQKVFLSQSFEAKVLHCNRQADNALMCTDETQLNTMLNAGSASAK